MKQKQAIKALVLSHGLKVLTIPWGVGRGLKIPINPQHELRIWLGLYEIEVARHLRRLVSPGTRCYDVGGQYGYDALVLARLSEGPVVSFESDRALIPRMQRTFNLNEPLTPNLTAVMAFVGQGGDETLSLDDFAGSQPPGFIKVDVEGSELDVLIGAERILRETRPALVVETHSRELEQACGQLLVAHGYHPRIVHQRLMLPDRRPIPHNRWLVAA